MLKKIISNKLLWIFGFALFIRTVNLGTLPSGLHVDEIKVGWNSLSILKTGLGDKNEVVGLYYDSFGDFRPSGIFYLTTIFLKIFGENIFAIRFSSAFFGALTVFPLAMFVNEIHRHKGSRNYFSTGEIAALLLALSPWHISTSRTTNEAVVSTFFVILSLLYFVRYQRKNSIRTLIFSFVGSLAAMSLYHSARLELPLLLSAMAAIYFSKARKIDVKTVVFFLLAVFACTLFYSKTAGGLRRFEQVSIFKDIDTQYELTRLRSENTKGAKWFVFFDNKYVVYSKNLVFSYFEYFSPQFLIGKEAVPYRYTIPGIGLIYIADIFLIAIGLLQISKGRRGYLPLILLLLAPVSASLTSEDSPNLQRSMLMLPFLIIIASYGLDSLREGKLKVFVPIFLCVYLLSFLHFSHLYFNHNISQKPFLRDFILDNPSYRNSGSKELALEIQEIKDNYQKIIVSGFPDNIYPWYAFLNKKDPSLFNRNSYIPGSNIRNWENIIFTDKSCPSDFAFSENKEKNILVINSWACGYESQIKAGLKARVIRKTYRTDGGEAYIFMERSEK